MSYTTIYKVTPGVSAEDFQELLNAWGSSPLVWDALFKRYVPPKHEYDSWMFDSDRLWKLWDREDIPPHIRAVLGMTFDRSYIERQHFRRAAADIRKFLEEVPARESRVNHWPAIADLMEQHADDEAFPALGFNQTSVSESLWEGEWDDATEERKPLEWSRFWSVYEELDKEPADASD
jgi:hypothetical protein